MYLGDFNDKTCISIHAPSRERLIVLMLKHYIFLFQSTLPRGSDYSAGDRGKNFTDFNPRSLAGATTTEWDFVGKRYKFQSTLPRGSDLSRTYEIFYRGNFNPRSLAGATKLRSYTESIIHISIHAPSRERPNP